MRADIGPGTAFPDYELPDHAGRPRRLAEIQGNDPMIIVLAVRPTRRRIRCSMRASCSSGGR
jgi:hypothetical protein